MTIPPLTLPSSGSGDMAMFDSEPVRTPAQILTSYQHDDILAELYAVKAQINFEANYSVAKIFERFA